MAAGGADFTLPRWTNKFTLSAQKPGGSQEGCENDHAGSGGADGGAGLVREQARRGGDLPRAGRAGHRLRAQLKCAGCAARCHEPLLHPQSHAPARTAGGLTTGATAAPGPPSRCPPSSACAARLAWASRGASRWAATRVRLPRHFLALPRSSGRQAAGEAGSAGISHKERQSQRFALANATRLHAPWCAHRSEHHPPRRRQLGQQGGFGLRNACRGRCG
jgi:hypothetical protein